MNYLIDGHNLIAALPDMSLADPDDEEALVRRLRQWTAASPKRRVTVIFDQGLPGGLARHLSGGRVTTVFASTAGSADTLLIRRIQAAHNPAEYTVVSSDREVLAAAAGRGMPTLRSEQFAALLAEVGRPSPPAPPAKPEAGADDVAEWLELFGGPPSTKTP
ncbi:MAG: NYN domain-containing protein [Chloroflexota bacterium]